MHYLYPGRRDPVARRFMWDVISRTATEQKLATIILTTHSMDECVALASKVGIMVGGRLRCLGTIQHVRDKYGKGYLLDAKMEEEVDFAAINDMETAMMQTLSIAQHVDRPFMLPRAAVPQLSAAMGNAARGQQLRDSGTGWAIAAQFNRSVTPTPGCPAGVRTIPLRDFAAWWAAEDRIKRFVEHITHTAFPGSEVLERHGNRLRFQIPPQTIPMGEIFGRVEQARATFNIDFSMGQTSLEQVFNYFAAQQEEETGVARGVVAQTRNQEQVAVVV